MKVFLDGFLPRLLPPEVRFETIAHKHGSSAISKPSHKHSINRVCSVSSTPDVIPIACNGPRPCSRNASRAIARRTGLVAWLRSSIQGVADRRACGN